jgi:hypothetical protein
MKPSIGRIVHFVHVDLLDRETLVHLPAIITAVSNTCVDLVVFSSSGSILGASWATAATFDESFAPYTWHWPERE